jgi:hypothetical protein
VEGKCIRRISELRWKQHVRKHVTQKKVHGQRLGSSNFGRTEADGEAWLLGESLKEETSNEEQEEEDAYWFAIL